MKAEMKKLNRVKYAHSEEEKKRLMEDGYKMAALTGPEPDKEDGREKRMEGGMLPGLQEPAEEKTAKKEGTKKK